jgi:hypothetical protein
MYLLRIVSFKIVSLHSVTYSEKTRDERMSVSLLAQLDNFGCFPQAVCRLSFSQRECTSVFFQSAVVS